MPSTSLDRHQLITKWFGEIDPMGPEHVLTSQGFHIDASWIIHKPTSSHSMTFEQRELVLFLVEEWDYGYGV
jgi:hypothetical protein